MTRDIVIMHESNNILWLLVFLLSKLDLSQSVDWLDVVKVSTR